MSTEPVDEAARSDTSQADATPGGAMLSASASETPEAVDSGADDAMKDQLRKDVASWREGRADGSTRQATELSVAVTRSIVPPTNARMKRAKPAASEAKPTATEKKPFGMSYDGTSRADYIKLMISRGAR